MLNINYEAEIILSLINKTLGCQTTDRLNPEDDTMTRPRNAGSACGMIEDCLVQVIGRSAMTQTAVDCIQSFVASFAQTSPLYETCVATIRSSTWTETGTIAAATGFMWLGSIHTVWIVCDFNRYCTATAVIC